MGPPVDLFTLEVHFSDKMSIIVDFLEDSFLPAVKELTYRALNSADRDFVGTGGIVNLEKELLAILEEVLDDDGVGEVDSGVRVLSGF